MLSYLSNSRRKHVDNLFMSDSDDALSVNLDDSVTDPDAASFGDAASKKTTDL